MGNIKFDIENSFLAYIKDPTLYDKLKTVLRMVQALRANLNPLFSTCSKTTELIGLKFTHNVRRDLRFVRGIFFLFVSLFVNFLSVKEQQLSPKRLKRLRRKSHQYLCCSSGCFGNVFFFSNVSVCLSVCM